MLIRLVMIGMTVVFMIMTLPAYYFGVYSVYKYRPQMHHGRRCSADLQAGIVSWGFTMLFAYLLMPALSPDAFWQGLVHLMFGGLLAEGAVLTWHSHCVLKGNRRRYQCWLAASVLVAAVGLLSQGIRWILCLPLLPWVDPIGLVGGLGTLIACEISFLKANGGRFLSNNIK